MYMYIFWLLTAVCVLCSLLFVVPVILVRGIDQILPTKRRYALSAIFIILIPIAAYGLYAYLGAAHELAKYYNTEQRIKRQDMAQLRPIYSKLQRETIKADLNLGIDLANLDLILHFATIHSQLTDGVLPTPVLKLLQNVLVAAPLQVTALNLLAVHAYKSAEYTLAVKYWNKILDQFSPEMLKSQAGTVLAAKISQARNLQADEPIK